MRTQRLVPRVLVAVLGVIGPRPVGAAPLPVTGTLAIEVATLPAVAEPFAGTVDLTAGTLSLPADLVVHPLQFIPSSGFPLMLITGILLGFENEPGGFSAGAAAASCPAPSPNGGACVVGGGFGGGMPVSGLIQVVGQLAIKVPLSVIGANGELVTSLGGISVQGAPWTTRTARVTTTGAPMAMHARSGGLVGALGAMSSTLTLVSPAHIDVAGLARVPVFSTLTLHFVPEPGTFVLLGAGLAGIAAAARRRVGRP